MKNKLVTLFVVAACVCMAFVGCSSPTTTTKSGNADLSALSLSGVTLSPDFSASVTSYTSAVNYSIASTTVTATPADSKATVDGDSAAPVELSVGDNDIMVTVTAEDGTTTKDYTVTVTRAAAGVSAALSALSLSGVTLIPAFSAGVTSYTASVNNPIVTTTVTATPAESGATVDVNPSSPVELSVGENNITITVTAEDGTTTQDYTVTITRAAAGVAFNDTFATAGSSANLVTAAYRPLTDDPALPMYLNVSGTASWAGGMVTLGAYSRFTIGANDITPTTATTTPGGCFDFSTPTTFRIRFGAAGAGLATGYFQIFVNNNTTASSRSPMGAASRIRIIRANTIAAGSTIDVTVPTTAGADSFLCLLTDNDVTSVQIDEISLIK